MHRPEAHPEPPPTRPRAAPESSLSRPCYVSALARLIGMGRPLLHMHLQRLEAAGLVVGTLEAGEDGNGVGVLVGAVGAAGFFGLLIVIVWQVAATWRARMLAAREEQYKELATRYARLLEDTVELQRRTAEEQRQTLDGLTRTRCSVGSMEKMMREIE